MTVRKKHIRELVERLLSDRDIKKPDVPVEAITKSLGIKVKRDRVDDKLSGFLVRATKQGIAIIGVNADHHPRRQRFTIAHELGHYLLHETEAVHFDAERPGFTVHRRDKASSTGESDLEREANLFAAELLMPARFLEEDVARINRFDLLDDKADVLEKLADQYNVSVQALTFRLANLGLINH